MKPNRLLWTGLILVIESATVFAADFGRGDVFGQAGGYTEIGQGGGTWGISGGGASVHLGSHVSVFGELNYVHPTVPAALNAGSVWASGNLFETGGGVRIFIPARSRRVRPYIPVMGGWLHASATDYILFRVIIAGPLALVPIPISDSGGYCGTGFGTEVGVTGRLGLRPEFRFFREFFGSAGAGIPSVNDNAMIFSIGAYYRIGKL
jgi:hypothetical protein